MSSRLYLPTLCLLLLFTAATFPGCAPARFTADHMVTQLTLPHDLRWNSPPVTIDDPAALAFEFGPDSADLLEHNWQSSALGQLDSPNLTVRIAVHRLGSKTDAANMLAQHKYPNAQPLKLANQAYCWFDRNAAQTIFFRRDVYFAQLTIDPRPDQPILEPLAQQLDKILVRRTSPF